MSFLWYKVIYGQILGDSKLREIFMITPEKVFAGLSILTVTDLLQLPSTIQNSR